jgi:hypothetical protein
MTNVELKMRFNPETEEVETLVDGKVLVASGKEAFSSWVDWHNDKYKPTVEQPVEEKVVNPDAPVEPEVIDPETPVEEGVDTADKE